jgi:putative ABC transport system substrate-binding protein
MRRRIFTLLAGAAASPVGARAQQSPKMLRVGTVSGQPRSSPLWQAFLQRMSWLGYQQGRTYTLDHLLADSGADYETLNRRFTAGSVDVLVAPGPQVSLKGALAATDTIPIVMIAIDYDPLESGFVPSLARPGGRATGIFLQQIEIGVKRLQLLKEAFPEMRAATVLWDQLSAGQWAAVEAAGANLGIRLFGAELRNPPYDFERALAQAPPECRGFLLAMTTPFLYRNRATLVELALRNRSILMGFDREIVEEGAVISYGANIPSMFARAADYVDRIAKGDKPGDLPIEQPTKFELIVNMKTAKAIGVTLSSIMLARADEMIE